jgi:thioesterase domain-containing protein
VKYSPKPFSGEITLFRTRQSRLFTPEPEVVWRRLASEVEVHVLKGAHETILHEPYVRGLATEIKACLEKSRAESH